MAKTAYLKESRLCKKRRFLNFSQTDKDFMGFGKEKQEEK